MSHLLYLMFRCDFDVMESLEEFGDLNTPKERGCQDSRLRNVGEIPPRFVSRRLFLDKPRLVVNGRRLYTYR